jgi:hypothetical protein
MVKVMDSVTFREAAQFIVKRNVSGRVHRVLAGFESERGSLHLIYCTRGSPTKDDEEDCEIACAELTAEFPEIKVAETQCRASEGCSPMEDLYEVYSHI